MARAGRQAPSQRADSRSSFGTLRKAAVSSMIDNGAVPLLLRVTWIGLLVMLTVWLPKATGEGDAENDDPDPATEKV